MATTLEQDGSTFDTIHLNGPYPTRILYKTNLEPDNKLPKKIDRYNDVAKEIQRLLRETLAANEGFRAFGARWSLSHIAHHKDRMHFNDNMNIKISISENEMHSESTYKSEDLFLIECGNRVKEITEFVKREGKSLKTCGASNGQSVAGSISTGIHGSALGVGSFQDAVVGINLIIGPDPEDIVYIERETSPALNDDFAKKINARVIRNDDLFNAALVGLGAFGFIHGVVVETEDLYLLNRYVRKINKEVALKLATTMDFKVSEFRIPSEVDANGTPNQPYHYKVFINPYVNESDYVIEIMYKKPFRSDYPDPIPQIQTAIYKDLILLFGKIAAKHKNRIPLLIKLLQKSVLPKVDEDTIGTLGEIFDDAINQGPAFACSVGVDHKDSQKALEVLVNLTKQEGPIPGIFAMRFIKNSMATLAFSKFPITCMIEIDGALWKGNRRMISLEDYCKRMIEVLIQNGIKFTIHWGKNAAWSFPGLVDEMYGANVSKWKEQRTFLLSGQQAGLFSNDFLRDTNLV
ncbi:MAG: hypothetical protein ABJA71_01695 [Ginsengibacter sp.]